MLDQLGNLLFQNLTSRPQVTAFNVEFTYVYYWQRSRLEFLSLDILLADLTVYEQPPYFLTRVTQKSNLTWNFKTFSSISLYLRYPFASPSPLSSLIPSDTFRRVMYPIQPPSQNRLWPPQGSTHRCGLWRDETKPWHCLEQRVEATDNCLKWTNNHQKVEGLRKDCC